MAGWWWAGEREADGLEAPSAIGFSTRVNTSGEKSELSEMTPRFLAWTSLDTVCPGIGRMGEMGDSEFWRADPELSLGCPKLNGTSQWLGEECSRERMGLEIHISKSSTSI